MSDRPVPQADPRASYLAHRAAIDAAIERVLASGRYILGPEVEEFEREFAAVISAAAMASASPAAPTRWCWR